MAFAPPNVLSYVTATSSISSAGATGLIFRLSDVCLLSEGAEVTKGAALGVGVTTVLLWTAHIESAPKCSRISF
jgi:hypothetical protein